VLLRHAVATLAYRAERTMRNAPAIFATFRVGPGSRTPVQIVDALTHVGQLTMLRRIAKSRIRAENYAKAHIAIGQVGSVQPPPVVEFE
jgi:hypothetical protein